MTGSLPYTPDCRICSSTVSLWRTTSQFLTQLWLPWSFCYTRSEHGMTQCWIDLGSPNSLQWRLYLVLISVVLFIIPAIIIICCYSVILCTLWSKGRMLKMTSDLESESLNEWWIWAIITYLAHVCWRFDHCLLFEYVCTTHTCADSLITACFSTLFYHTKTW